MVFIKSYSKSRSLLTGMIAVTVVMFLSAGCTGKTGSGHPEMTDDPVGAYGNYLSEVRKLDDLSTKELAVHINRWRAARDSAFSHAIRDTSGNPHSDLYGRCERIHDSLRTEFIRLALARSSSVWHDPSAAPVRTCLPSRNLPLLIMGTRT